MAADTAVGRIRGQGVSGGDSTVSISWKQSAGLAKLWPRAVHTSSEMLGPEAGTASAGYTGALAAVGWRDGTASGRLVEMERERGEESGCLPASCGGLNGSYVYIEG
ncbi:unnamed protein product [Boreogadus saida]